MNVGRLVLLFLWTLLVFLAFPGGPYPLLTWVSFVPFGIAIATFNRRQSLIYGSVFSFITWLSTTWWLALGIVNISHRNPLIWWIIGMVPIIVFSIPYVLFCYLAQRLKLFDPQKPRPVLAAALLTLLIVHMPNCFPNNIAHSLFKETKFIQICDIGGITLLLFIVNLVNFLFSSAILGLPDFKIFLKRSVSGFLIIFAVYLYGDYQVKNWEQITADGSKFKVGIIQPNIPINGQYGTKRPSDSERDADLRSIIEQTESLFQQDKDIQLFVWPEIPLSIELRSDNRYAPQIDLLLSKLKKPLLLNATYVKKNPDSSIGLHNAMHIVSDNILNFQSYLKNRLVPFAEYNPFEDLVYKITNYRPLRFSMSHEVNTFKIGDNAKVATPICLEGIYSDFIEKFIDLGANVIINPSDDAYFGYTRGPEVHLALASFRAVEFRVPLIRSANSGISQVFNQSGQALIKNESIFSKNSWVVDLRLTPSPAETDPNQTGNLFTLGFLLLGSLWFTKDKRVNK